MNQYFGIRSAAICLCSILFWSCNPRQEQQEEEQKKNTAIVSMQEDISIINLKKNSFMQAIEKFGKPAEVFQFNVKDGLPEYRIEIYNFYGDDQDIIIKEALWKKNDSINITLWYIQENTIWKPFHGMEWNNAWVF